MLRSLFIKNFAIIDNLEIEFSPNLNIITGETGAGKSIMIDALMVLLGDRASVGFVRSGQKKAIIEGVFSFPPGHKVFSLLDEAGYDYDNGIIDNNEINENNEINGNNEINEINANNEIIVRRDINIKGSSRSFLNDTPIRTSLLKKIGDMLVDFHGQHDHQSLLRPEIHIELLDATGNYDSLLNDYISHYRELETIIKEYNDLRKRAESLKEKRGLLKFQLDEITKISPEKDEDSRLEEELKLLRHSEELHLLCGELSDKLYSGENSATDILAGSEQILGRLSDIDKRFDDFKDEFKSALISISEIAKFTLNYLSNIQFNPERIEEIRMRLQRLKGIVKKYGSTGEAIEAQIRIAKELGTAENIDSELQGLRSQIENRMKLTGAAAATLSDARQKWAGKLEAAIVNSLNSLGIENADFKVVFGKSMIEIDSIFDSAINSAGETRICVRIDRKYYNANGFGCDEVEFYISTNKGESPKPLSNVASGGEISRVMLAIKALLADSGDLPILIFDEIDTGISGRVARKVGLAMKELAKKHQVIAITHLPQIAAFGDLNISVSKSESDGRTSANAVILNHNEKLMEIAKLISGEEITDAALESAKELVE